MVVQDLEGEVLKIVTYRDVLLTSPIDTTVSAVAC